MNREHLGPMLEENLAWPVLSSGDNAEYRKMVDDELQRGAEGFWNDVIDALVLVVSDDESININRLDLSLWLEDQKIGDDE